jgi:hypothetical protein
MKTTSDDARYTVNQLVEAANLLEIQLSNARRLLERTDLPGAFDQLDRAIDAAAEAEADISVSGPCGMLISIVTDMLERLMKELPDE